MSLEYIPPAPTKMMIKRSTQLLADPKTIVPHTFYATTRAEFASKLRQAAQEQGKSIQVLSAQTHVTVKDVAGALKNGEGRPQLLLALASALGGKTITIPSV